MASGLEADVSPRMRGSSVWRASGGHFDPEGGSDRAPEFLDLGGRDQGARGLLQADGLDRQRGGIYGPAVSAGSVWGVELLQAALEEPVAYLALCAEAGLFGFGGGVVSRIDGAQGLGGP